MTSQRGLCEASTFDGSQTAAQSVVEDVPPLLSVSLDCLHPHPDSNVSQLQRCIYFDCMSYFSFLLVHCDWRLTIECRDSLIPTPLGCLVLVATGSWALLPTSHSGPSGFLSSLLDTSSSTPSTVVGASVSETFPHTKTTNSHPAGIRSSPCHAHPPLLPGVQCRLHDVNLRQHVGACFCGTCLRAWRTSHHARAAHWMNKGL